VAVRVGVRVRVGVIVGVGVIVRVGVIVGVLVGVLVCVGVGVGGQASELLVIETSSTKKSVAIVVVASNLSR
jgi:hypothetical protein